MNIQFAYQKPGDLADHVVNAALALATMDVDGTRKVVVLANAMGQVCAVDVEALGIVEQLIDGESSGIFGGMTGTRLTAKYTAGTALTVTSETGFSAGDPIAVLNLQDLSDVKYGQVASTAANTINIEAALGATFYKNAYVVNLKDMLFAAGVGFNHAQGVKALHEAPSAPLFTVDDGTGDTIDVSITDPEQDAATHFDIFVRKQTARPDRFEPNWQPDAEDKTVAQIASAINVTTYGGGADYVPDGAGGTLATTDVVWVGVLAKNGTGQTGVKRSPVLWTKHTLD